MKLVFLVLSYLHEPLQLSTETIYLLTLAIATCMNNVLGGVEAYALSHPQCLLNTGNCPQISADQCYSPTPFHIPI